MLAISMLDTLNIIDTNLKKDSRLIIVESVVDQNLMLDRAEGNDPDHLFGEISMSDSFQSNVFGPEFAFSVGASDIQATRMKSTELFELVISLVERTRIKVGHVVLHSGYYDNRPWVHINNDPYEIFGPKIGSLLRRHGKYTYTMDGGKTFREYELDGRRRRSKDFQY